MSSNIRIKRICQHCAKEFEARKTTTKYCSHHCARRSYKDNLRELKIELSNKESDKIKNHDIEQIKTKEFLSISEVCQLTGVSRRTLYRMIGRKELNVAKFGRRTIIKRTDIDTLFEKFVPEPEIQKPTEPKQLSENECYTMTEVQMKYGIAEKTLYELVKRNNIYKFRKGAFAYVPKAEIDNLFKTIYHASKSTEKKTVRRKREPVS